MASGSLAVAAGFQNYIFTLKYTVYSFLTPFAYLFSNLLFIGAGAAGKQEQGIVSTIPHAV
jgi:hypothetical protein